MLKWSATLGRPALVRQVEAQLCAEEITAARTAAPTLFGRETIIGAFEPGKSIAIVSNNSASPADCILIGDSMADIDGAHAAGVPVIGYANRPEKVDRFTDARADVVITSMVEVASALVELRL